MQSDENDVEECPMNEKTTAPGETIGRLLMAVSEGREEEVAELLAAGANPDGTDADGIQTPLLNVSKTKNEGIARRLLAAGASVNKANLDGVTPLH